MNSILKYFIIICLLVLGFFIGYVKYVELDNKKPTIYLDNHCGERVRIMKSKKLWAELDNGSTIIKRDLKQGTHFLYIHKTESNVIDTISIYVKEKKKYILNPYKGMTYTEEEIMYKSVYDGRNVKNQKSTNINRIFFETDADYILKKPVSQIKLRSKNKSPEYFNAQVLKKYLKRQH